MGVIRNVIFDWSGTLCNDLPPVLAAINRIFEDFGAEPLAEAEFRARFCLPYENFYRQHLATAGDVSLAELERRFVANYDEAAHPATEIGGALEFFEQCRRSGRRLFLLSAVKRDHFERQAAALGFDLGAFCEVLTEVRDKRVTLPELLDRHGLEAAETVMIGDMVHDIEAAHAGGVHSVAVLTGYDSLERLSAAAPATVVRQLGDLGVMMRGPSPLDTMPVATVGALIFNDAGEVLLVRTHKWSGKWGIAGGKIRRGETAEAALRRETREETGLEIDEIRPVLVQDCVDSPEFERPAHFLLLNYTARKIGGEVCLNEEAERFVWIVPQKALEMDLNVPTRTLIETVISQA